MKRSSLNSRSFTVVVFIALLTLCLQLFWGEPSVFAAATDSPPSSASKKLAIVIDDLGNGMTGTEEILDLPIALTVAVMPFLSTTKRDAEWAHAKGKAVFVHLPMEPMRSHPRSLGPGAITLDLTDEEIRHRVEAAIDDVPYATGINNHMGSKATGDQRVMRIVLEVCKKRGIVFLDSKTNYRSVAGALSREMGVRYVENELFLDDVASMAHVRKKVREVKKRLEKQEKCVVIGHVGRPGKQTSQVLRAVIPEFEREFRFVTVPELAEANEMLP